ncbi:hypothetical protein BaRGS_00014886 [Batillaria attramentaria]|uniref:Uncharacterized protein n=1 Tax=Batillaria attramentaria TaxID=370345 RepID=A0ABD0L4F7_9CAEN
MLNGQEVVSTHASRSSALEVTSVSKERTNCQARLRTLESETESNCAIIRIPCNPVILCFAWNFQQLQLLGISPTCGRRRASVVFSVLSNFSGGLVSSDTCEVCVKRLSHHHFQQPA